MESKPLLLWAIFICASSLYSMEKMEDKKQKVTIVTFEVESEQKAQNFSKDLLKKINKSYGRKNAACSSEEIEQNIKNMLITEQKEFSCLNTDLTAIESTVSSIIDLSENKKKAICTSKKRKNNYLNSVKFFCTIIFFTTFCMFFSLADDHLLACSLMITCQCCPLFKDVHNGNCIYENYNDAQCPQKYLDCFSRWLECGKNATSLKKYCDTKIFNFSHSPYNKECSRILPPDLRLKDFFSAFCLLAVATLIVYFNCNNNDEEKDEK